MNKVKNIIIFLIISLIVPITLNYIVYFGYTTNYNPTFKKEGVEYNLDHGVYKFRILYKPFLRYFVDLSNEIENNILLNWRFAKQDGLENAKYHRAYFFHNTFFFIIFSALSFFIFGAFYDKLTALISILLIQALIAISQFVLVPYDVISYVFFVLGAYYSAMYFKYSLNKYLILLNIFILISVFNRETAALNISFFVAMSLALKNNKTFKNTIILIMSFLTPYLFLRLLYGFTSFDKIFFLDNFSYSIYFLGFVFSISLTYIFYYISKWEKASRMFLILSFPYFFMIITVGIMYEFRLLIPIWIGQLLLHKNVIKDIK
jgi:hypothetical protein